MRGPVLGARRARITGGATCLDEEHMKQIVDDIQAYIIKRIAKLNKSPDGRGEKGQKRIAALSAAQALNDHLHHKANARYGLLTSRNLHCKIKVLWRCGCPGRPHVLFGSRAHLLERWGRVEGSRTSCLRFALFTKACQLPEAADGSAREFARSDADVQRNPDSRRETIRPPQASALERRLRRGLGADLAMALHAWAAHLSSVLLPGVREAAARGREAVKAAGEADEARAPKAVRGGGHRLGPEGALLFEALRAAEMEVQRRETELAYVMWYGFGVHVGSGQQQQQQQGQGHGPGPGQGQGQQTGAQPQGGGAPRDWLAGAWGVPRYVLEPRVVSRRLRWCGPDVGLLAPFGAPCSPPLLPPPLRATPALPLAPANAVAGDGHGEHTAARGEEAGGWGWGEGVDGAGAGAGEEDVVAMGLEAEEEAEAEASGEASDGERRVAEDARPRFPFTAAIQIDGSQHLNSNHTTVSVVEQQRVDRRNDLAAWRCGCPLLRIARHDVARVGPLRTLFALTCVANPGRRFLLYSHTHYVTLDWHWALRLPPAPAPGRSCLWLCRLDRYRCFLLAEAPLELWEWAGMAGDEQGAGGEGEGEEGEEERDRSAGEGETVGEEELWEGQPGCQGAGEGLVVYDDCAGQAGEDEEQEEGEEAEGVDDESEVSQAEEQEQELERQALQQQPRALRRLLSMLPRPAPQQPTAGEGHGSGAAGGDLPVAGLLVLGAAAAPAPAPKAGELGLVPEAQPGAHRRRSGDGRCPGRAGVVARWEVFDEAWFDRHPKKKERMLGQRERWREEQLWEQGRRGRVQSRKGLERRELEGQPEASERELEWGREGQVLDAWGADEGAGACIGTGAEEWMRLFSEPLWTDTGLAQEANRPEVALPSGPLFDSWDELEEDGEEDGVGMHNEYK